jgi:hypothetical protein
VFKIELIRGSRWEEPVETVDWRECHTESIEAAVAEARHWLIQTQTEQPHRGATHYRVVGEAGIVVGGPP